jgi:membrane fusion protein (multidrug efflux system)
MYKNMRMNGQTVKKLLPILALSVGVALVASCGRKQSGMAQSNEFPVKTLETGNTQMSNSYPATIRGKQDVEIRPKISGFITRLCVDEGSVVHRGQVLFTIDNVQYHAALNEAKAAFNAANSALATSQLTYKNKLELHKQNIIGDYDLQTAANNLATAKANLAQTRAAVLSAKENLSYCTVVSPSNGVVGSIPFRVGSLVGPSMTTPMTTVSNIEEMYVYFSMTEKQLLEMSRQSGSKNVAAAFPEVQLQLADGSIYNHVGHVSTVSGVIDQSTGSVSVRANFLNPDHLLKSGGTGSIVIPYTANNTIIIPQSATVEVQNKIFVYIVGNDNKVKYTEITVNPENDGENYIVTSGLKAGDKYVTKGITKLSDGMEIKPITEQQYEKNLEKAAKLGAIQGDYKKMKEAFK